MHFSTLTLWFVTLSVETGADHMYWRGKLSKIHRQRVRGRAWDIEHHMVWGLPTYHAPSHRKYPEKPLRSRTEKRQTALFILLYAQCSVASVVSDSLWLCGRQHARLPCPSPAPRGCSNSCPLSRWCHPTISSSVIPFSSCLQSFPASGPFQMSQLFVSRWPKYWGFNFSISLFNEYSGLTSFRMDWLNLLAVQGTPKSLLQHRSSKASFTTFYHLLFLLFNNSRKDL